MNSVLNRISFLRKCPLKCLLFLQEMPFYIDPNNKYNLRKSNIAYSNIHSEIKRGVHSDIMKDLRKKIDLKPILRNPSILGGLLPRCNRFHFVVSKVQFRKSG